MLSHQPVRVLEVLSGSNIQEEYDFKSKTFFRINQLHLDVCVI